MAVDKKVTVTSKSANSDKDAALESALKQITKQYGAGAVMRLGENSHLNVDTISTGSFTLDMATGIGGFPRGRVVEIYGPESSGKTTLALHAIAEAQKQGGNAAFIDAEHALDPVYAMNLGVDIDALLVSQPDYGEQALEITEQLVRSGALDIVVVDSVAALVPRSEIDGEMGDSHVGLHARLMSQALRKLTGVVNKSNCLIIFINQLREKVGVLYGNPEVTTGGRALKFYSSMRIDIRKKDIIKGSGGEVIGNRVKVKIVKNKLAPPFKQAEFDIMYGQGINKGGEIVDVATELDIIKKSGSWFSYGDDKIGQGREKAKEFLVNNPDVEAEIEAKIKEKLQEIQQTSTQKYRATATPKADEDDTPEPVKESQTIEGARAKLAIAVDDDED